MDQRTAEQLAALFGGEAWSSGKDAWIVTVNNPDGSVTQFDGDSVCDFESEEACSAGNKRAIILVSVPNDGDLYVLVDTKGKVFYNNDALERGWRHEEDAEREAKGLWSRGEGTYQVVRKSDV